MFPISSHRLQGCSVLPSNQATVLPADERVTAIALGALSPLAGATGGSLNTRAITKANGLLAR